MAATINTGTTSPTVVLIQGDEVSANLSTVYVYEQTSAGTPSQSNSILLGSTTSTPPRSMASLGIPNTTDVVSSWSDVRGLLTGA